MAEILFERYLEQLGKPLQYAMRNNYAQLPKLKGFEPYVRHQIRTLEALRILPAAWLPLLQELSQAVESFDTLSVTEKQQRMGHVHTLIGQMRDAVTQGGSTPAPPPAAVPAPAKTPRQMPTPHPSAHQVSSAAEALPEAPPRSETPSEPFQQSVQYLRGVGPKRASLLAKLNLRTVNDLLWYLPARYEDRRRLTPLGMLQVGQRQTFYGRVCAAQTLPQRRGRPIFTMTLEDDSGTLTCKWFKAQNYMQERFAIGARVVGSGVITLNSYNASREAVHPDLEVLEEGDGDLAHFGRLVPIYPSTAGLHQKALRTLMKSVMDTFAPQIEETLPLHIRRDHALPTLQEAVRQVHFPEGHLDLGQLHQHQTPFHQRLIFEEFFLLELGLALRQRVTQREQRTTPYQRPNHLGEALISQLPFRLTAAQQRVLSEVLEDMQRPFPMNRLIQGDVGSGKTVVALLAMLMVVSNDFQAAIMTPTEILAEQHAATLRELLEPLKLDVSLITGSLKGRARRERLEQIAQGQTGLVVGTHALLYDEVQFRRLGMIVVDEQHRFGVLQRATLRSKGLTPDVLVMTATPIPRTLSMTLYGDLDISVIDELPPGRLPVQTKVLRASGRDQAYRRIRREVSRGQQAYIVYPLIEESESLDLGAAVDMAAQLQQEVFPDHRLGLLHGRLSSEEKDAIMRAFKQRELDILVCTTVIEVGVDIPNATVMVIENAEHFGLAQLHQLRGRVGRGADQAYCLLIAGDKLSKEGRQRLLVMQKSHDGFYVAEQDLQIRGPGELLGTKQAGLPELHVGNLLHHGIWLEQARRAAFALIEADPSLKQPEHQSLRHALSTRWRDRFELAAIG
jgi:ATP-dependent DNA helicase RecG